MKDFMEVFEKEYLPLSNRLGRKMLGQWTTAIGTLDQVTEIWVYDDLTHMQRFNEARAKSLEFGAASEHLRALIAFEETRLLLPTKLSELK